MTYLLKLRALCESCEKAEAILWCIQDHCALCKECDEKVHVVNRISQRHERVNIPRRSVLSPLCNRCQRAPSAVYIEETDFCLCELCEKEFTRPIQASLQPQPQAVMWGENSSAPTSDPTSTAKNNKESRSKKNASSSEEASPNVQRSTADGAEGAEDFDPVDGPSVHGPSLPQQQQYHHQTLLSPLRSTETSEFATKELMNNPRPLLQDTKSFENIGGSSMAPRTCTLVPIRSARVAESIIFDRMDFSAGLGLTWHRAAASRRKKIRKSSRLILGGLGKPESSANKVVRWLRTKNVTSPRRTPSPSNIPSPPAVEQVKREYAALSFHIRPDQPHTLERNLSNVKNASVLDSAKASTLNVAQPIPVATSTKILKAQVGQENNRPNTQITKVNQAGMVDLSYFSTPVPDSVTRPSATKTDVMNESILKKRRVDVDLEWLEEVELAAAKRISEENNNEENTPSTENGETQVTENIDLLDTENNSNKDNTAS